MSELCSDEKMKTLIDIMGSGESGLPEIETLLIDFPNDSRLHFLKGSVLSGEGKLIEAHSSLSKAVEIAPDFSLARFQLGFFQLTSGEPDNALKTWEKLRTLPETNYLNIFATGLTHLINDRFPNCIASLKAGIAANIENQPLNHDMGLIIAQCETILETAAQEAAQSEVSSSTSALLGQFKKPH